MVLGKCGFAIKLLAWYGNRDPEAKSFIEGEDKVFQFDLKGEDPFSVRWQNGAVSLKEGKHEKPDVSFIGDSDIVFKILLGEIDQDEAYNTRKVEITGSIIDASKIRHFAEMVQTSEAPVTRAEFFALMKELSGLLLG